MKEDEFYEKISEWIEKDKSTWNHITYLAYFCYKYEEVNGVKFRLVRSRKGPTMGKEAADFAKLFKIFAPEDYDSLSSEEKKRVRKDLTWKIYNYINWMFDYKFRRGIQSVNGTRIFHTPSIIVEFERMYNAYIKKKDGRNKMDALIDWCKKNVPDIFDFHQLEEVGDLEMLKGYAESYSLDEDSKEIIVINKAKELGLI